MSTPTLSCYRSVADALKSGKSITPEMFKISTVYFSDICSFTEMSSVSTPIEVVDFLNDLWTVFDDIIDRFNVYKVFTAKTLYTGSYLLMWSQARGP